jgi:hypothetical protein
MYKKTQGARPSTLNADGSQFVLVELRGLVPDAIAASERVNALGIRGCTRDATYDPVPMAGGTAIVRCHVQGQMEIDALRRLPEVVDVWPETPIEPMRPS